MKRIYFTRHAKSSWKDMSLSDIERPLNKRGMRDAPLMSSRLRDKIIDIEYCIISPARRAQLTAEAFISDFSFKSIVTENKIYHGSTTDLLEVLADIPEEFSSAIIFGHNPGYTYLHNHFAHVRLDNLPTCGIFELLSDSISWKEIETNNTRVGILMYPKMFT